MKDRPDERLDELLRQWEAGAAPRYVLARTIERLTDKEN
jgi:hypothetical protein